MLPRRRHLIRKCTGRVLHGSVARLDCPLPLIIGLFKDGIRIYEPYNTGWWYDLGFYISIIAGFGGLALSRKHRHRRKS